MEQHFATLISQTIGVAFPAAARPFVTFFLVQAAIAVGLKLKLVAMDPSWRFLVSAPMLVFGVVVAVVELLVEHSHDLESVLRGLHVEKPARGLGAAAVAVLMMSIGSDAAEVGANPTVVGGVIEGVDAVRGASQPAWVKGITLLTALGLNQGLTWLRGYVMDWLDDLHLTKVWHYVETGGVVGFVVLLGLAPFLVIVLGVLATAAMVAMALVLRAVEQRRDAANRRACEGCRTMIRGEATVCWGCQAPQRPTVVLGQ